MSDCTRSFLSSSFLFSSFLLLSFFLSTSAFLTPISPLTSSFPSFSSTLHRARLSEDAFRSKDNDNNDNNDNSLIFTCKEENENVKKRKTMKVVDKVYMTNHRHEPQQEQQQLPRKQVLSRIFFGIGGVLSSSYLSNNNKLTTTTTTTRTRDNWVANAKGVKRIKNGPIVTLDSGVQFQEMSIGEGATPELGDRVAVHYSLFCNGFEVESTRDSSGLAARPFGFNWGSEVGYGSFPKAVQQGMKGMQIGGRRKITVPAKLAYGEKGRPPFIPPNSDVLFDVSIWSIKPAGINPNLTLSGQQNYF